MYLPISRWTLCQELISEGAKKILVTIQIYL